MTHPGMKSGHVATGVASAFAVMLPIRVGVVRHYRLRSPVRFNEVETRFRPVLSVLLLPPLRKRRREETRLSIQVASSLYLSGKSNLPTVAS
jgi:hypothetical protein